jgi:hypothetical protein
MGYDPRNGGYYGEVALATGILISDSLIEDRKRSGGFQSAI